MKIRRLASSMPSAGCAAAFEAVMEREGEGGRQRGFFVAFGYSRDAEQECAAFHKRTGRIIKLLTVQSRRAGIDEEHGQKM